MLAAAGVELMFGHIQCWHLVATHGIFGYKTTKMTTYISYASNAMQLIHYKELSYIIWCASLEPVKDSRQRIKRLTLHHTVLDRI